MRVTMRLVEDAEREQAQKTWLNGGSALPLVSLHHRRGEVLEASAVARAALENGDAEAVEIERLLYERDDAPPDWIETLRAFAAAPSIERWRDLMRFVPPGQIYQRSRNTVRRLRQLGVDTNLLFLCATNLGMTPAAGRGGGRRARDVSRPRGDGGVPGRRPRRRDPTSARVRRMRERLLLALARSEEH